MLTKLIRSRVGFAPALFLAACAIWSSPGLATEHVDIEVFHNFSPEPLRAGGGENPRAGVILGPHGNLYGTTQIGGKYGRGTIYETQPSGKTRILHSFGVRDGAYSRSELTLLGDVLYGSTWSRPTVLFKYEADGGFTRLHTFNWDNEGGLASTLLLASDGNFYGTIERSQQDRRGALFRMTPSGERSLSSTALRPVDSPGRLVHCFKAGTGPCAVRRRLTILRNSRAVSAEGQFIGSPSKAR